MKPGSSKKANSNTLVDDFVPSAPAVAWLRSWLQLVKIPLCLPIACSAGFGFIFHTPTLAPSCGAVICGVFLLACGAAGCNSLQEKSTDRLFIRTRHRPLVTGRLTEGQAAWFSALLIALGLTTLLLGTKGWSPPLLGILALFLYNGIYTPLKQISVFALFPGALAGAAPPLIGWTAAGGEMADKHAWLLFSLFFLWQIPHFCFILLRHQEDYRTVERPTLIKLLPEQSLQRIALIWILAFNTVALSLTLYPNMLVVQSRLAIGLMAGVMTMLCIPLFFQKNTLNYQLLFTVLNGSFFTTLLIIAFFQLTN